VGNDHDSRGGRPYETIPRPSLAHEQGGAARERNLTVSIVIDNYDYERYVGGAIESALAQTYPYVEVVVVDDGSTDGSRRVINGYRGGVRVIEQPNLGQGAALNSGFASSTGDIVIFLDADDELYPEAAERVVQRFRPGVAKLQFRLDTIDAKGARLGFQTPSEHHRLADGQGALRSLLRTGKYITSVSSGNAYPRAILARILPMPEAPWRVAADGYLVTAAVFFGEVVAIEECLGAYRLHGANWSTKLWTADAAGLRALIVNDLTKHALVEDLANANGLVANEVWKRDHVHLRVRIASLRMSPGTHPIATDRRWHLAWRGVIETMRHSDLDLRRRMLVSVWFVVVGFAPSPLAIRAVQREFAR
jgi:glycosyltransferase involved in cell wall biosynthesis